MTSVSKFYNDVIEDVISGVRDDFMDEGFDVQVLDELKKLWKSKLSETHVYDPEPSAASAAQYLNLLQRPQVQIHPASSGTQFNIAPAGGLPTANVGLSVSGHLTNLRLPATPRTSIAITTQAIRPSDTQSAANVTSLILPAQPQTQKQPQTATILSGVINAGQLNTQSVRPVTTVTMPQGGAPQLATLPSGLTGHLVQIGQQTFLVPQALTTANIRQPGANVHVALQSQYIGNANITNQLINSNDSKPQFAYSTDLSQFKHTQVDGGHDSDDDKFCDTPTSQPMNVVGLRRTTISRHVIEAPQTNHISDMDDDDDDDDDDDLVPATPGFTPPSSVRSSHYNHLRHPMDTPRDMRGQHGDVTPLMSAPPTPMSPPMSVPPQSVGSKRIENNRSSISTGHTLISKRQRRSPCNTGGAEIEPDDDYDDDISEDAEIMTNTTVTPAGPSCELDEDDYGTPTSNHTSSNRHSKYNKSRTPMSPKFHGHSNTGLSKKLLSPSALELGVPEPVESESFRDELEQEDGEEEDPLNSEDDVSDEEPEVLFESDNVVVCQYDKIHRSRNKWRFHLKDGIMSVNGRDHVFQKAVGEAEW